MQCDNCGQTSDWVGVDSDWSRLGPGHPSAPLYECDVCGNRQRPG